MTNVPQASCCNLFDVIRELLHVGIIAAGSYVGWIIGHHFLTLLVGAYVGRLVGIGFVLALRSCLGVRQQ